VPGIGAAICKVLAEESADIIFTYWKVTNLRLSHSGALTPAKTSKTPSTITETASNDGAMIS
jgi:hypothetical protein